MAISECDTQIDAKGRELITHGTALFPVACYHDDLTREAVPWHWHDEMEAALVEKGRAIITAGAESYTVEAGDAVFTNAAVLHADWNAGAGECRLHSVVFHPRLVGGMADSVFWQKYLQPLIDDTSRGGVLLQQRIPWQRAAIEAIEGAYQACAVEEPGYEFQVRESLSRLILQLSAHQPAVQRRMSEKALRDGERMKLMLHYIQTHYEGELNTALIARSALISVSECLRCFHATIGVTPIQYVQQFRVQKAAELLGATALKVSEIGLRCGFQEMSYFAKAFKALRGCTPSEFRGSRRETKQNGQRTILP